MIERKREKESKIIGHGTETQNVSTKSVDHRFVVESEESSIWKMERKKTMRGKERRRDSDCHWVWNKDD